MAARAPWQPVAGEERLPYDVQFGLRVMRDAFAEASSAYWTRRAEELEAARPRRGDFHGAATHAELTERYQRLTAAASACRNRAALGDVARSDFNDAYDAWIRGAAA